MELSPPPASTTAVKTEPAGAPAAGGDAGKQTMAGDGAQAAAEAAQPEPSLISAVTQAAVDRPPSMQSMLGDGHVFMPPMPADLQAELASSASSSFNAAATFGTMQQQLSATLDSSALLAGDLDLDLFSSPNWPLVDADPAGEASALFGSTASLNAATGSTSVPKRSHIHLAAVMHLDTVLSP